MRQDTATTSTLLMGVDHMLLAGRTTYIGATVASVGSSHGEWMCWCWAVRAGGDGRRCCRVQRRNRERSDRDDHDPTARVGGEPPAARIPRWSRRGVAD